MTLPRSRNYLLLLVSQFLGAFGDNAILVVILGPLTHSRAQGLINDKQLSTAVAAYTALLFIPYVLLAPLAGFVNDRFPKTAWLKGGNFTKFVGTLIAAASLLGPSWLQAVGYFIVGIGACVFSPAKYGILPEILPEERLVKANGTVELLTLVGILGGMVAGGKMIDYWSVSQCYLGVLILYGIALMLNFFMAPTPSDASVRFKSSVTEFFSHFGSLVRSARLSRILFGTGLFWVCGATLKMNLQPWAVSVLGIQDNLQISLLGFWLSVGIMLGSILAGVLHKVGDLRAIRFYGVLLSASIFGFILHRHVGVLMFQLAVAGAFAGLFLIPLNAALQSESHRGRLGKTIAAQNFIENVAMLGGGVLVFLVHALGGGPLWVFAALAICVLVAVAFLRIPNKSSQ